MTKTKVDAMEAASNTIQTSHAGVLLQTLVRALASVMDSEVSQLCGAEYGCRSSSSGAPPLASC